MKELNSDKSLEKLINNIVIIFNEGKKESYFKVNSVLVNTYWEIGKNIVEFEQK
jgi:hypothetical protein